MGLFFPICKIEMTICYLPWRQAVRTQVGDEQKASAHCLAVVNARGSCPSWLFLSCNKSTFSVITFPPNLKGRFHGFLKMKSTEHWGEPGLWRLVRMCVHVLEPDCQWLHKGKVFLITVWACECRALFLEPRAFCLAPREQRFCMIIFRISSASVPKK